MVKLAAWTIEEQPKKRGWASLLGLSQEDSGHRAE